MIRYVSNILVLVIDVLFYCWYRFSCFCPSPSSFHDHDHDNSDGHYLPKEGIGLPLGCLPNGTALNMSASLLRYCFLYCLVLCLLTTVFLVCLFICLFVCLSIVLSVCRDCVIHVRLLTVSIWESVQYHHLLEEHFTSRPVTGNRSAWIKSLYMYETDM